MQVDTPVGLPIYILDEKIELPKEGNYYILGSNGLYLHTDNGLFSSIQPAVGISCLEEVDLSNSFQHNLPLIPLEIALLTKLFFAEVVKKYNSESYVALYYNKTTKQYAVDAPEQIVSYSGVHYTRDNIRSELPGYIPIGTIHSHCDFTAFHSNVDDADEVDWDGVHITFGNNDLEDFTIAASIMIGKQRKKIDPLDLIEGIEYNNNFDGGRYAFIRTPENIDGMLATVHEWLEKVQSIRHTLRG